MAHKQQLADLFEDAASAVPAPSFALDAWLRAKRVRRRRRRNTVIGLSAAAAVLAVTAVSVLQLRGPDPDPDVVATVPPTTSAPSSLGLPAVHQLPDKLSRRSIPGLPTDAAALMPTSARKLSEHPVDRAVAVVQSYALEGATDLTLPVYVLGTDGAWAEIDVVDLVTTDDANGNKAVPLLTTSLSPDRRQVAFPQPGSLVVVDLSTAKVHRIAVPGPNEQVVWFGDRTVLVGQAGPDAAKVKVDWAAGTATTLHTGMSIWDIAAEPLDSGPVLELPAFGDGSGFDHNERVRAWQLDRPVPDREIFFNDAQLANGYGVVGWQGPTLHNGAGRLVRAGWGEGKQFSGLEVLAVVNADTGVVERLLDLGRDDRTKQCCRPLDWVDDDTVLVHTDKEGLITWNVRTGAIAQAVAGPIAAVVSIRLRTY